MPRVHTPTTNTSLKTALRPPRRRVLRQIDALLYPNNAQPPETA